MLLLYSMKEKTSVPILKSADEIPNLLKEGFFIEKDSKYVLTDKAKKLITKLDNYFIKAKKKTDVELMGKDFTDMLNSYRNIFPPGKLPSNMPSRQNVRALGESFRWFFETYDYTWEEILKATRMYVNEYRETNYLYMVTSQYFIAKQDKHKVKHSKLADYCDMIKDGVQTKQHHFKEKVV